MKYSDLSLLSQIPEFKEFCKNEWIELYNKPGCIDMRIFPKRIPKAFKPNIWRMKDDHNALGYLYILNELYNKGIKCVQPTFEQCLTFENVEINIPFKEYNQPFETIIVEFPEKYCNLLRSRYGQRAPIACTCHKPIDAEYLIGALSFGINNYNITFFITNYDTIIEELVNDSNPKNIQDPDFLPVKQAQRVALNILLFMLNFGHNKLGYTNIKQHRYRVRKKPDLAKEDFYYYGLKQEIKLYTKQLVKRETRDGSHASPRPHWRKGHWKTQHYGPNNSLTKLILIHAVFVCSESYKGDLNDTQVTYL